MSSAAFLAPVPLGSQPAALAVATGSAPRRAAAGAPSAKSAPASRLSFFGSAALGQRVRLQASGHFLSHQEPRQFDVACKNDSPRPSSGSPRPGTPRPGGKKKGFGGSSKWANWASKGDAKKRRSQANNSPPPAPRVEDEEKVQASLPPPPSPQPEPAAVEDEEAELLAAAAAFPLPVDTSRTEPEIVEDVELSDAMKELLGDAPDIERPPPTFNVVEGYEPEKAAVPKGAWDSWRTSVEREPAELEARDPEKEKDLWRDAAKSLVPPTAGGDAPSTSDEPRADPRLFKTPPPPLASTGPEPPKPAPKPAPKPEVRASKEDDRERLFKTPPPPLSSSSSKGPVPPKSVPKPAPKPEIRASKQADKAAPPPPAASSNAPEPPKPAAKPAAKPAPEVRDPKKDTDQWRSAARDLIPEEAKKEEPKAAKPEEPAAPAEAGAWGAWQEANTKFEQAKGAARDSKAEVDFWRGAVGDVVSGDSSDASGSKPPAERRGPEWVQPDLSFLPSTEESAPADPSNAWASWSQAREAWEPEKIGEEVDMAARYERISRGIAGFNAAEAGVDYAKAEGFDEEDDNVYPDEEGGADGDIEAIAAGDDDDLMYLADDVAEGNTAGAAAFAELDGEEYLEPLAAGGSAGLTDAEKYAKYSAPVEGESDEERRQREAWAAFYKPRAPKFEVRDPKKEAAFWKAAARDLLPDAPAAPVEETEADFWRGAARDLSSEEVAEEEEEDGPAPEILAAQRGEREEPKWVIPEGYEPEGASVPAGAWDAWRGAADKAPSEEEATGRDAKAEVDAWRAAAREVRPAAQPPQEGEEARDPRKEADAWRAAARDLVPGSPEAKEEAPKAAEAAAEPIPPPPPPSEPIIVNDAAAGDRTSIDSWLSVAREAAGAAGVEAGPAARPAREAPKWVIPEGYDPSAAPAGASFDAYRAADAAWESQEFGERDAQAEVEMWRGAGAEAARAATQGGPAAAEEKAVEEETVEAKEEAVVEDDSGAFSRWQEVSRQFDEAPAEERDPKKEVDMWRDFARSVAPAEGAAAAPPAAAEPVAAEPKEEEEPAAEEGSAWGAWSQASAAFAEANKEEVVDPSASRDQWRDLAKSFVPEGAGAAPPPPPPPKAEPAAESTAEEGGAWGAWSAASEAFEESTKGGEVDPSASRDQWRDLAKSFGGQEAAPAGAEPAPAASGSDSDMWRSFARDVSEQVATSSGAAPSPPSSKDDGSSMWRSFARDVASQMDGSGAIAPAARPGALAKGKTPETDQWRAIARAAITPPADAPRPYNLPPGVPPPAPTVLPPSPPVLSPSERSAWDAWSRVKSTPDWALAARRTDEQSQWISAARDMPVGPNQSTGYRRLPSTEERENAKQAVDFGSVARSTLSDPAVQDALATEEATGNPIPTLETGRPAVVDPEFSVNKVLDSYKSTDETTELPPVVFAEAPVPAYDPEEEAAAKRREEERRQLTLGAAIAGGIGILAALFATLASGGSGTAGGQ